MLSNPGHRLSFNFEKLVSVGCKPALSTKTIGFWDQKMLAHFSGDATFSKLPKGQYDSLSLRLILVRTTPPGHLKRKTTKCFKNLCHAEMEFYFSTKITVQSIKNQTSIL